MPEPNLQEQMEAIRKGFRRAGRRMVLSSSQALVRGLLVLGGCAASYPLIGRPWWQMCAVWAGIVAVIAASEAAQYVRLAKKTPGAFVTGLERQMLKFILLTLAIGTVLSAALVYRNHWGIIPGSWMLLVGAGYVVVGLFSFSDTWVLGLLSVMAGAVALFVEPVYALALLGLVLGLGSVVWAGIVRARKRHSD